MITLSAHHLLPTNALFEQKYQSVVTEPGISRETSSSGEESASPCLPRNTLVLITGNNRTKKILVGQHAVVKRSVGLGGWHHCVLQDGSEVKLQRNALSVLEMGPPELGDDPSGSSSDTEAREPNIEIMTHPRIRRLPKALFHASELPLFKKADHSNSSGLRSTTYSLVDLHKLETTSLKRYRRVFQLPEVDAAAPKAQLVTAVQRHFTTQEVEEQQVLSELVRALQRRYRRQQLLSQQYPAELTYSDTPATNLTASNTQGTQDGFATEQQALQQQGHEEPASNGTSQQQGSLYLLQPQYVYMGPGLFQEQPK